MRMMGLLALVCAAFVLSTAVETTSDVSTVTSTISAPAETDLPPMAVVTMLVGKAMSAFYSKPGASCDGNTSCIDCVSNETQRLMNLTAGEFKHHCSKRAHDLPLLCEIFSKESTFPHAAFYSAIFVLSKLQLNPISIALTATSAESTCAISDGVLSEASGTSEEPSTSSMGIVAVASEDTTPVRVLMMSDSSSADATQTSSSIKKAVPAVASLADLHEMMDSKTLKKIGGCKKDHGHFRKFHTAESFGNDHHPFFHPLKMGDGGEPRGPHHFRAGERKEGKGWKGPKAVKSGHKHTDMEYPHMRKGGRMLLSTQEEGKEEEEEEAISTMLSTDPALPSDASSMEEVDADDSLVTTTMPADWEQEDGFPSEEEREDGDEGSEGEEQQEGRHHSWKHEDFGRMDDGKEDQKRVWKGKWRSHPRGVSVTHVTSAMVEGRPSSRFADVADVADSNMEGRSEHKGVPRKGWMHHFKNKIGFRSHGGVAHSQHFGHEHFGKHAVEKLMLGDAGFGNELPEACIDCIGTGLSMFEEKVMAKVHFMCKFSKDEKITKICDFISQHPYLFIVALVYKTSPWKKAVPVCVFKGECPAPPLLPLPPFGPEDGPVRPFGPEDEPFGPGPFGPDPFGPHPFGPDPFGPGPHGPHPFGPDPFGPGPHGPHPFGPDPFGPHDGPWGPPHPPRGLFQRFHDGVAWLFGFHPPPPPFFTDSDSVFPAVLMKGGKVVATAESHIPRHFGPFSGEPVPSHHGCRKGGLMGMVKKWMHGSSSSSSKKGAGKEIVEEVPEPMMLTMATKENEVDGDVTAAVGAVRVNMPVPRALPMMGGEEGFSFLDVRGGFAAGEEEGDAEEAATVVPHLDFNVVGM